MRLPVKVRGVDADGETFEIDTALDNVSAAGLYVRVSRRLEPGANVFALVRLSTNMVDESIGARVEVLGQVTRVDRTPDGSFGLGVAFRRHRLMLK